MVVDSSVVIAILLNEPEAEHFTKQLIENQANLKQNKVSVFVRGGAMPHKIKRAE